MQNQINALKIPLKADSMQNNIHRINKSNENLPKNLNGPEGSISAKTLDSIKILERGLKRLERNVQVFEYTDVNLLNCMTLEIEHILSMREWASSYGRAVRQETTMAKAGTLP